MCACAYVVSICVHVCSCVCGLGMYMCASVCLVSRCVHVCLCICGV